MNATVCTCLRCGATEEIASDMPCSMKACMECGGPMTDKARDTIEADGTAVHTNQATIDYDLCTNCGECIDGCIYGQIEMVDGRPVVDPTGCSACLACALACPEEAIQ